MLRYIRASQMLDDKEGYDLYAEVLGHHATQLQTRSLTKQKAQHDLNDSTAKQLWKWKKMHTVLRYKLLESL